MHVTTLINEEEDLVSQFGGVYHKEKMEQEFDNSETIVMIVYQ
jgi:hypothetical protein